MTRLRLRPDTPFDYEPGQYVTLVRNDGLARSYSLASLPEEKFLEFHVRKIPSGQMSEWIHDKIAPGERVKIQGPTGTCFYVDDTKRRPLLMVGTGTGLAPLWGIVRAALRQGHLGPITVVHGARNPDELYLREELQWFEDTLSSFHYLPCVLEGGGMILRTQNVVTVAEEARAALGDPASIQAYVCGGPNIVRRVRRTLFMAGLSSRNILYDAFVPTPAPEAILEAGSCV